MRRARYRTGKDWRQRMYDTTSSSLGLVLPSRSVSRSTAWSGNGQECHHHREHARAVRCIPGTGARPKSTHEIGESYTPSALVHPPASRTSSVTQWRTLGSTSSPGGPTALPKKAAGRYDIHVRKWRRLKESEKANVTFYATSEESEEIRTDLSEARQRLRQVGTKSKEPPIGVLCGLSS
ncbi:hypothetical protein C8Q76DRAFT_257514 [Earliella scabrosa]|nr:hypothetical protein C8Q76DRAFT_257514 [Earliella scabrosa]